MTELLSHKTRRTDRHHVRHTYLVDVGTAIDIPLLEVSKLFENVLLDPPYPKTRYFEIEIDEKRDGTTRTALFQNIFPVRAEQGPDLRFMMFRIRRGSWTVTERIHFPTDTGEAQWLYTDDFNILFLSAGGRHDLSMLIGLITEKLGAIARSYHAGAAVPSHFEEQVRCRTAFNTLFREGVDKAFRDVAVYRDCAPAISADILRDGAPPSAREIGSHHGWSKVSAELTAALHVDISEIEDLNDLGWLCT